MVSTYDSSSLLSRMIVATFCSSAAREDADVRPQASAAACAASRASSMSAASPRAQVVKLAPVVGVKTSKYWPLTAGTHLPLMYCAARRCERVSELLGWRRGVSVARGHMRARSRSQPERKSAYRSQALQQVVLARRRAGASAADGASSGAGAQRPQPTVRGARARSYFSANLNSACGSPGGAYAMFGRRRRRAAAAAAAARAEGNKDLRLRLRESEELSQPRVATSSADRLPPITRQHACPLVCCTGVQRGRKDMPRRHGKIKYASQQRFGHIHLSRSTSARCSKARCPAS